jgi:Lrp/AsnC family transcriptional regulator
MSNAYMTQQNLDRTDLKILELLQQQGNLSAAEVAEKVGLTATTAWRRISRLEQDGVIRQRVALLDREAVGLSVTVFAHVRLSTQGREAISRFEQVVRKHPEIMECYTMLGETDFLLRIVTKDVRTYEAFYLDHLSKFPAVQVVNSSIALSVIKETTALPLSRV